MANPNRESTSTIKDPGELLHAFMENAGVSQKELAEILGVHETAVSHWRMSSALISPYHLGSIIETLQPPNKEAERFIIMVNPGIIERGNKAWLNRKIAAGSWNHINFPALDSTWLDKHPLNLQAGLLLKAFRNRKRLSVRSLADRLGVSDSLVSHWETGIRAIPEHWLASLEAELELSNAEAKRFGELAAFTEKKKEIRESTSKLGAVKPAAEFPGLTQPTQRKR